MRGLAQCSRAKVQVIPERIQHSYPLSRGNAVGTGALKAAPDLGGAANITTLLQQAANPFALVVNWVIAMLPRVKREALDDDAAPAYH
jgi:hypothetical protein